MKDYFFNVLKGVRSNSNNQYNKNEKDKHILQEKNANDTEDLINNDSKGNYDQSLVKYSNSINFLLSLLKDSCGKERTLYINMALNLIDKLKNNIGKFHNKLQIENLDLIRKYLKKLKSNKNGNSISKSCKTCQNDQKLNDLKDENLQLNIFLLDEKEDKLFNSSINNLSSYKSDSEYWNMSEKTRDKSRSTCKENKSLTKSNIEENDINDFDANTSTKYSSSNILNLDEYFHFDADFLNIDNNVSDSHIEINQNLNVSNLNQNCISKEDDVIRKNSCSTIDLANIFDNSSDSKYDISSVNDFCSFPSNEFLNCSNSISNPNLKSSLGNNFLNNILEYTKILQNNTKRTDRVNNDFNEYINLDTNKDKNTIINSLKIQNKKLNKFGFKIDCNTFMIPEFLSDKIITKKHDLECKTKLAFFLASKRLYAEDKTNILDSLSDKEVVLKTKADDIIYLKQYNNLLLKE